MRQSFVYKAAFCLAFLALCSTANAGGLLKGKLLDGCGDSCKPACSVSCEADCDGCGLLKCGILKHDVCGLLSALRSKLSSCNIGCSSSCDGEAPAEDAGDDVPDAPAEGDAAAETTSASLSNHPQFRFVVFGR